MKAKDFDAKFNTGEDVLDALDLSKAYHPTKAPARETRHQEQAKWLKENHQTISTDNKRIEKRSPALSTYRRFENNSKMAHIIKMNY